MRHEATEEQSRSWRSVGAEPAESHGRKHEQPRQNIRTQTKAKSRNQVARAQPQSRSHEQIHKRERDPNRVVHRHGDCHFMIHRLHTADVSIAGIHHEPSAQTNVPLGEAAEMR